MDRLNLKARPQTTKSPVAVKNFDQSRGPKGRPVFNSVFRQSDGVAC